MWLAIGSLLTVWWKTQSLGPRLQPASCLPALAIASLPLYLRWRGGACSSQLALLWYLLNPVFCARTRLCIRAFHGSILSLSLFFFPLGDPTVWVVVSCQLPQIVLMAFRPGHPKHAAHASQFNPPLAAGELVHLGYFSVGSYGQACNLWVFCLLLFLPVMLPPEIPKLPTDPPVRGFPGV